jgi:hypothetical protein
MELGIYTFAELTPDAATGRTLDLLSGARAEIEHRRAPVA